jgi:phage terminase large subunit
MIKLEIKRKIFNECYLTYLYNYIYRILIFFGGSSSGKSNFVAMRNIINLLRGGRNYLVCRKVGATIKNTVFAEYKKAIYRLNVDKYIHINESDFSFTTINGYKMLFKGLDDIEKVKSLTFEKGILTDIHVEEATDITEKDFNQLQLRLRGKYSAEVEGIRQEIKKQIVLTFNPINISHWIKTRLFDYPDENINILKTTYKDNKFLTEDDIKIIESYKTKDLYYYNVYALGEWGSLGGLVYTNWKVEDLSEIENEFNHYYYGLDFGYVNPAAIAKMSLKENKIYIFDEYYEVEKTNKELAAGAEKIAGKNYIFCDSSDPKSIKELRIYGLNALAVKKGKDSVKHGIQWIKQHEIIVSKKCTNFINELQLYKYKEDPKTGKILKEEPLDLNNHLMDAMRYGFEHMMKAYKKSNYSADDLGV